MSSSFLRTYLTDCGVPASVTSTGPNVMERFGQAHHARSDQFVGPLDDACRRPVGVFDPNAVDRVGAQFGGVDGVQEHEWSTRSDVGRGDVELHPFRVDSPDLQNVGDRSRYATIARDGSLPTSP